jgi:hypothetical protein
MIEPLYDFSREIDEMTANDPDIASELRDKRTNWDLRDRIEKLDGSKVLLVKLWAFRDHAQQSEKGECRFCTRSIAIAETAAKMDLVPLCLLCWFRAGRPFESNVDPIPQQGESA